jgi:hypothetical protein
METRSLQQNRYYWKVVVKALQDKAAAEGNPIDKEYAHRLAMIAIGHSEYVTRWGIVTLEPKPTRDMLVSEYEEILERVRVWAAQHLETDILLPNEGITYPVWDQANSEGVYS